MGRARPPSAKTGYYVHLPATRLLLIGATACLVVFDVFLVVTDSYFPSVMKSWLDWSEPLTNAMGQYIPAVSGIGDDMVHRGAAARAPLMKTLVAGNWAILLACYVTALVATLVEALPKAGTVAHDIEAATSSWRSTLGNARAALWVLLGAINLPLLTSWIYPSGLYRSDAEILFVCFLFFCGILFTPRWILFHLLLLRAESRRILNPPEPEEG